MESVTAKKVTSRSIVNKRLKLLISWGLFYTVSGFKPTIPSQIPHRLSCFGPDGAQQSGDGEGKKEVRAKDRMGADEQRPGKKVGGMKVKDLKMKEVARKSVGSETKQGK